MILPRFSSIVVTLIVLSLLPTCGGEKQDPQTRMREQSLQAFAALQKQLGVALKQSIQSEGFSAAIATCQTASPRLEGEASSSSLQIRRISDRVRNPKHAPDPYEASILKQWREDMASGRKPGVLSADTDEGFRVMKPIFIQNGLCLQCHGGPADLNPDAAREIARLYPDDQAKNYKMGDLRGAFSAVWKR